MCCLSQDICVLLSQLVLTITEDENDTGHLAGSVGEVYDSYLGVMNPTLFSKNKIFLEKRQMMY